MENTENKKKPFRVGYILISYPSLTKTFVDREILTLHQMGIDVRVYSMHPSKSSLSPYQEHLAKNVIFLQPAGLFTSLTAHRHFFFLHPVKYISTLAYLLTRPHPTFKSHWRTLRQFHYGIYTAYLLKKDSVDHIHAHFLNQAATIALVASRMIGMEYSISVHASTDLYSRPMMLREKLQEAKFIATCTDYNQKYLEKIGKGSYADRVKVVYHGLDTQHFQRKQKPASRNPLILGVGQLRERKGFQYLIDACAILRDQDITFQCHIVGEGPVRAELEEQIRNLGLTEQVRLCGAMTEPEVREQYERASIFTLPAVMGKDGDRDGIPNVILEAMAMELPVVSTQHSAIPEVIEDGKNGLLVPSQDPQALAEALRYLIRDPELRRRLGKNGRQTVHAKFDPVHNARALVEGFQTK